MTPLSPTEKEQVAELLGWRNRDGSVYPHWWREGHRVHFGDNPVTLEAMFAYCRERKWAHSLTWWSSDGKYVVEIAQTDDIFEENIGDADDPDPIVAFARALLAAKEVGQ